MSLATLIRRMTDAGAPPEAIALAVEEIEAMQGLLDSRRTADRERKRAQRERLKTANVTGQSEDRHETVTPISPSPLVPPDVSPQTPLLNPPLSPNPTAPGRVNLLKGIGLPDWLPSEPWAAFVRMRKAIPKVPFTEDSARGAIRKCDKLRGEGYDPAKLLWKAVDQGWRTVFPNDECKATSVSGPVNYAERAKFYTGIGQLDKADECRRKAVSLGQLALDAVNDAQKQARAS